MIKILVAVTWLTVSMASWSVPIEVEIDGTSYDVSTIKGSFRDNFTLLMNQVWWVDSNADIGPASQLALAFSDAVGDSLGLTDCGPSAVYPLFGPRFALQLPIQDVPVSECGLFTCAFRFVHYQPQRDPPSYWTAGGGFDLEYDWAVATPSQVPLPATAWLFVSALVALMGVARRVSFPFK